jgi:hypothetical protein
MPAQVLTFTPRPGGRDEPVRCGSLGGVPAHVWRPDARLNDRCLCGQKVLDREIEPALAACD